MQENAATAELKARALGAALPPLVVRAERIAATVMMGTHGLRRAGAGENFWAYRNYAFGDSTQRIDWRKSAKADDHFIRENEWQVANTLWLWVDGGPRMNFTSHLAEESKRQRAQVLGLAMAALALRAHERVGLLGQAMRASFGRDMLARIARLMEASHGDALPRPAALQRRSTVLLVSDFLSEVKELRAALELLAASGMRGHLVQVTDPAEESLPYEGRVDFLSLEGGKAYRAGSAENLREAYAKAFTGHRDAVRNLAKSLGFSFSVHHTDQSLAASVLKLHQLMGTK